MTTTTLRKTIPWGERIATIVTSKQAAEILPIRYSISKALADGQNWAEANKGSNGHLGSGHEVLEERIRQPDGPAWNWLTLNSEEDTGRDADGRFGKKGELVGVVIHGGGILLNSPQRVQEVYSNKTPKGEPSLRRTEITRLLAGNLPNGQQIQVYTLQTLAREDPNKLPQIYGVVAPIQTFAETQSGRVPVDKLAKNNLFIARAGHPLTAEEYSRTLGKAGAREYGNWHPLEAAVAETPSGRVLHAGSGHNGGLVGYGNRNDVARFVGVRQVVGAEGAAPRQASTLDELVGKGRDAGNGVLVINARNISLEAYNALTGAK